MNCERFRAQSIDRLRGALSAAEERALAEHLESCPACAAEAAAVEEAWMALGALPEEEPGPAVADRFYAFLAHAEAAMPPKRSWAERLSFLWPRQPALQAAMVALALVGGILLGNFGRRGEMGELRGEVRTLQHMVALSLLQRDSASERLRGVSLSSSTDTTDPQVLSALLDAVRNDQSVNVRLAAIDALAPRAGRPQVRAELLAALARESSPLVQVAIADAVLASDDADARIELEQSLRDERLNPEVKSYVSRRLREAA
jgi:anti-sigma factor RsiW